MDIDVDQSVPRNDMIVLPDGKYLYIDQTNNSFDIDVFRRDFQQYRDRRRRKMVEKLEELNASKPETPIMKPTLSQMIVNAKDSIFGFMDDMLQGKFGRETFTKDNRSIYFGIIIIFIAIIAFIFNGL